MGVEFVGRTDELAAIDDLLAETRRARRVGALLLIGEPGIGKSRLLDEVEARQRDGSILRFAGYEPESSVPLAAAAPLLRRIAAASEDRTFLGLLDPDAGPEGLDAIRIFESVHRQLSRLRPSALFIDDLQWVDPVSLALCHFLVRAAVGSGRGLALVVASRPSPIADRFRASLTSTLGEADRPSTLDLQPLDRAAGVRFVASRSGTIDARDAVELWERAGGSPFWLELLVQARDRHGDVHEVVAARVGALGTDARHLLTVLAVLGRPADPQELELLLGWPADRTTAAAGELELHGLAVERHGMTRLAHDLIRAVVTDQTPPAVLRRVHTGIADALEREAGEDASGLLAVLEHRSEAGAFDVDLALRILASPQRRLIGSDGLRRILDSARDLEDGTLRARVDQAAAMLAEELGDQPLALDRWSTLAASVSDHDLAARAEFGAALACYHLERGEDARRWLERSRARTARAADLEIASDALEARILLWLEHRTDEGRLIAMRGVERGRLALAAGEVTAALRAAHLDALIAAWEAAIQGEQVAEVLVLADEALEVSHSMSLREVIEARAMIGLALEYAADQREAARIYREVLDDAWRMVLPVEAVDVGFRLAAVLVDILELEEARRVATETERLAARVGDQGRVRDRTRLVTYHLAMMTSDWRTAIDGVLAAGAEEPDPHYGLRYPLAAAVWLARLGHPGDEAVAHAEAARHLAVAAGCIACARDTDVELVEVFAQSGRLDQAREALVRWDAVGRPSWVESEWLRRRAGVLVDAAGDDGFDPSAALISLRDDADRQGLLLDALWVELDTGRLLGTTDRAAAAAAYRRAAERADAAGATTLRSLAIQGLRALGERPWRRTAMARSASELGALSAREREVADLVAGGATNPEIATRLFLSRKTVEHHVSNALAKLGLRSRSELAAYVGRSAAAPPDRNGAPPP